MIDEYRQHRDWEAIKNKYDVRFTDWRKHTKNALKKHVPPHQQKLQVKAKKPKVEKHGLKDNGNHKGSAGKGHKKT